MTNLSIGNIALDNPFIAAPLAGVTDSPMRRILRPAGAALVCTEMVSGKGLLYNNRKTEELLTIYEEEKPVAYQIFGNDPEVMEETAVRLAGRENAILDINMGCPVPKIVKNGEGSALLKDIRLLHQVAAAVVRGAERGARECGLPVKPVTAKIRTGWDADSIVTPQAAIALEEAGVAAVTVHARTREQFYAGKANWEEIARAKSAVSIPVIGNGDVFAAEDGLRMLTETGCDFVMVGRGMLGNPWIFRELEAAWRGLPIPPRPDGNEKRETVLRHFEMLKAEKGERRSLLEMRKHLSWYTKNVPGAAALRKRINCVSSEAELRQIAEELFSRQ